MKGDTSAYRGAWETVQIPLHPGKWINKHTQFWSGFVTFRHCEQEKSSSNMRWSYCIITVLCAHMLCYISNIAKTTWRLWKFSVCYHAVFFEPDKLRELPTNPGNESDRLEKIIKEKETTCWVTVKTTLYNVQFSI